VRTLTNVIGRLRNQNWSESHSLFLGWDVPRNVSDEPHIKVPLVFDLEGLNSFCYFVLREFLKRRFPDGIAREHVFVETSNPLFKRWSPFFGWHLHAIVHASKTNAFLNQSI